jgi:multiple sugar transport system permease protein
VSEASTQRTLAAIGVSLCLIFCLVPFVYMVWISFSPGTDLPAGGTAFTLAHYATIVAEPQLHFLRYLLNSAVVSLVSAAASVLVAALAAYAVTRLAFPGRMVLLVGALVVTMFPPIGMVGYLFRLMVGLGWINTYQGLFLPYAAWTLPLSLWILTGYFAKLPRELDAAAMVDGCSRWQILWKVLVPVAAPGVLSVFLLAFIYAFNEFLFALMLTTDQQARTVPVAIAMFQGAHGQTPWAEVMAAAVLATAPIVLLSLLFQRQIVEGLTHGAVKG